MPARKRSSGKSRGGNKKRRTSPSQRKTTRSKPYRSKFAKVMREHSRGKLHSGKGRGKVKNRKQAMAIAHSEARKSAR